MAGLLYVSGADGHLDDNEIGDVLRVVPDRQTLDNALKYCRQRSVQQFIQDSAALLSPQQKMCLMLNAIDLAMGDGHLDGAEQQMLMQFAQAFGIPEQQLQPHVQSFMIKNNLNVF
ncbi:MAG: TerB family tellurite resistance protein [Myxococcota bacterium]